jgi:acetyl/propionyl-CoA carboxylase alpha subunit
MADKFLVRLGDEDVSMELRHDDGQAYVRVEGEDLWKKVTLDRVGETGLHLLMIDNKPLELYIERRRGGAVVTIGRLAFDCDVGPWRPPSARAKNASGTTGRREIKAPMTGSIVDVRVKPGDIVEPGDVVLVIESMKMNNELRSPAAGVVHLVQVIPGQKVQQGALLVALEA